MSSIRDRRPRPFRVSGSYIWFSLLLCKPTYEDITIALCLWVRLFALLHENWSLYLEPSRCLIKSNHLPWFRGPNKKPNNKNKINAPTTGFPANYPSPLKVAHCIIASVLTSVQGTSLPTVPIKTNIKDDNPNNPTLPPSDPGTEDGDIEITPLIWPFLEQIYWPSTQIPINVEVLDDARAPLESL